MPIIHLVGPNAIGKTTAVTRWGRRYAGLSVASLDLPRREAPDKEGKRRYLESHSTDRVLVAESVYASQLPLLVVSADTGSGGSVLGKAGWVPDPNWKGDQAEKERKVNELRAARGVVTVESARTTTSITFVLSAEPVIIVTCSGEALGRNLKARCEKKGKKFRGDYWTADKLDYEARRRYTNFAAKNLRPEQVRYFTVENQEADWPAVDEYFGQLFRRMHNELVRARSAGR